jgi:eukaryotic-like serine/threonine-protein kinase
MQPSERIEGSLTVGPGGPRTFRLVQVLGRSGSGDVYLAEHDTANGGSEAVVLKVLHGDAARLGALWERMQDEARLLQQLGHPAITPARAHVRLENRRALLTDYVPGADLEHVLAALELAGERFPPRAAFEVGAAVAHALDAASTTIVDGAPLGLLHRDLEPSNVRITTDGAVKILDFGLARGPSEPEAASVGLVGTEAYMAPERLLGRPDTPAGDVYSLAATLVELLVGRPFGRTPIVADLHAQMVDHALKQVAGQVQGPRVVVQRAVETLRAALDVRPEVRPTALELGSAFDEIAPDLDGEALGAFAARYVPSIERVLGRMRTPLPAERVGRPDSEGTLSETTTPIPAPPLREMIAWLTAAAAVSALCGAGSMFGIVQGDPWGRARVEVAPLAIDVAPTAVAAPAVEPMAPTVQEVGFPVAAARADVRSVVEAPERPIGPRPAAQVPTQPPEPPAARKRDAQPSPAAVVDRALFVVPDASTVRVTCGAVSSEGTATVRITRFPAGTCTVVATVTDGRTVARGAVDVDSAVRIVCEVDGQALRCSPSR